MNSEDPILPDPKDEKAFRIAYLISGFLKDDLTGAEHTELDDWVTESMANQRLFEELIDEKNIGKWLDWKNSLNIEEALERVRRKTSRFRTWIPYISVAAAISVIITLLLIFENKFGTQKRDQQVTRDIPPGNNRASLVLENGSTLLLDTVRNGRLGNQGNSIIIKSDSRKLSYQELKTIDPLAVVRFNTLSTPRGGQYQLVLADGTRVWLNATSSLRFPTNFSGGVRKVELTGEGYFEVSKDPTHPFIVLAGGTTTQVLGTHFNINAYSDETSVRITLAEGLVTVNNSVQVIPEEQVQVDRGGGIQKLKVDINTEIGWKDGSFVFKNTPLREIMLQVSRWYDATVNYKDNVNEHFNTIVSRDVPVSKLLHLLEATGSVHFSIEGKKIEVLK